MNQLNALADSDSELRKYFVSALACDELPKTPGSVRPRAYIVNTQTEGTFDSCVDQK